MNILTFDSKELQTGILKISDYRAVHLRQVLKVNIGQEIKVGLIGVGVGKATILEVSEQFVILKVNELFEEIKPLNLELLVALPRPQTVKKILELAACYSIFKLTFVDAAKVEKSYFQSSILATENINKHLLLGMQQGLRTYLPKVEIRKNLEQVLLDYRNTKIKKYIAEPNSLVSMSGINLTSQDQVVFAIGPEGGWTKEELESFEKNLFLTVKLSNSVLRVEHALSAILSQYELATGVL